jgi:hypothetical protein
MRTLDQSGLVIFSNRTPAEVSEDPVTSVNGRTVSGEEQDLLTQARKTARKQDHSMLNGLVK